MSDWFFDDGSAQTLLDQNYGLDHGTTSWAEPQTVSAPSEDPLFGDDPTTVAPVVITAYDRTDPAIDGHSGRETDTTQITPDAPEDPPSCTPPPEGPVPANVDISEMRGLARDLADEAARRDARDQAAGQDIPERAALIWRDSTGGLHVTRLYDSTTDQHAVFPIGDVAPGGGVVGTFHTHPERSGTQEPAQDVFGRDDRGIADDLRDSEYARDNDISVDENAMTYVNDNETGDLKEFDSDDGVNDLGITVGPCGSGG